MTNKVNKRRREFAEAHNVPRRAAVNMMAVKHRDVREVLAEQSDVTTPVAALIREAIDGALEELSEARDKTLALADELIAVLGRHAPRTLPTPADWQLSPSRLRAIVERPTTRYERPRGSLHRSSLIANAEGEQLLDHLRSEFDSADRIDLLCAFVKLSGLEKLRPALERHCVARGRPLRVLTTTYMGASDQKAIDRLPSERAHRWIPPSSTW